MDAYPGRSDELLRVSFYYPEILYAPVRRENGKGESAQSSAFSPFHGISSEDS
jgi:hypothetical protein